MGDGLRLLSGIGRAAASYFGTLLAPNGAYHGASSHRQALRAWRTTRGSADIDILSNLDVIRSRARDLARNVPAAAAAVQKKTVHVVGTGLRWRPRLDSERLGISAEEARRKERELAALFDRWAKSKDADASRTNTFYQLQSIVWRGQYEAGDIFALLPFIERPTSYLDVSVKLVESDLCRNPSGQMETRRIAGGVELGRWGEPVAYWLCRSHPEDLPDDSSEPEMVRVPAYGEETGRPLVLHIYGATRPGQRRGISALAPVIEPLKNLGRYKDAELMAAVVAGMFTVFVKTPMGVSGGGNVPPSALVGDTGGSGEPSPYEMTYGGIVDLAEGEEIQIADPGRPNPNFDPFTFAIMREVGGALGMPVEMIEGYYRSSYTAARAAFLDAYRGFRVDRQNLVSDFCEPVKNTVYLNAVLRGVIDLPGYLDDISIRDAWQSGQWVGDAPGQLDPLKEAQAYALRVSERFTTRRIAAQELSGEDFDAIVAEQADEQRIEREAGLVTGTSASDGGAGNA